MNDWKQCMIATDAECRTVYLELCERGKHGSRACGSGRINAKQPLEHWGILQTCKVEGAQVKQHNERLFSFEVKRKPGRPAAK